MKKSSSIIIVFFLIITAIILLSAAPGQAASSVTNEADVRITGLCQAILADNYGIAFKSDPNTPAMLVELLETPNFYELWKAAGKTGKINPEINSLISETGEYRMQTYDTLSSDEKNKIKILNRALLDLTYDNILGTTKKAAQAAQKTTAQKKPVLSSSFTSPAPTYFYSSPNYSVSAQDLTKKNVTYLSVVSGAYTYPNPFSPQKEDAKIVYTLSANADVKILIFDMAGNLVWQREYPSGAMGGMGGVENEVAWNGCANNGQTAGNGVYYYFIMIGSKIEHRGQIAVKD